MSPTHWTAVLTLLGLALSGPLPAQQASKKLYCWDQAGQRICSDTLPAEAVNAARDEFSAKSGLRSGQVNRVLSEEEKDELALQEAQQASLQAEQLSRQRIEQALLSSFNDEAGLRRVFDERITMADNNVQTARYNVNSLRQGLVVLLEQAGERELRGQKVSDEATAAIIQRRQELNRQLRLLAVFERQRQSIDGEIEQTLLRYRELKAAASPAKP